MVSTNRPRVEPTSDRWLIPSRSIASATATGSKPAWTTSGHAPARRTIDHPQTGHVVERQAGQPAVGRGGLEEGGPGGRARAMVRGGQDRRLRPAGRARGEDEGGRSARIGLDGGGTDRRPAGPAARTGPSTRGSAARDGREMSTTRGPTGPRSSADRARSAVTSSWSRSGGSDGAQQGRDLRRGRPAVQDHQRRAETPDRVDRGDHRGRLPGQDRHPAGRSGPGAR